MDLFFGRFHVLLLHLPIGLMVAWLVIEALRLAAGRRRLWLARASVAIGAATAAMALVASICGILLVNDAAYRDSAGALLPGVASHRFWGLLFSLSCCVALGLQLQVRAWWPFQMFVQSDKPMSRI